MSPDQGLLLPLLVHHHKVEHGVGQAARASLLLVHNNILVSETDIFIRTAVPVSSQTLRNDLVVQSLRDGFQVLVGVGAVILTTVTPT